MKRSKPSGWQLGMMRGAHEPPPVPASFDMLLVELKITEKEAARNPAVQMWVRANHLHKFVPEKVLSAVGVNGDWL